MAEIPKWVRLNRFAAWTAYFCALIGFASLAMTLTAAGSGHHGLAVTAGIICALAFVGGLSLFSVTVHRDHVAHHAAPNLLSDKWAATHPGGTWPRH
ncbi:MAG: hypothetical protein J2P18_11955 [Nocardia sp.]|nr:hypothetical protein [Nocardia sp.]